MDEFLRLEEWQTMNDLTDAQLDMARRGLGMNGGSWATNKNLKTVAQFLQYAPAALSDAEWEKLHKAYEAMTGNNDPFSQEVWAKAVDGLYEVLSRRTPVSAYDDGWNKPEVFDTPTSAPAEQPCSECGNVSKVPVGDPAINECDKCYAAWDPAEKPSQNESVLLRRIETITQIYAGEQMRREIVKAVRAHDCSALGNPQVLAAQAKELRGKYEDMKAEVDRLNTWQQNALRNIDTWEKENQILKKELAQLKSEPRYTAEQVKKVLWEYLRDVHSWSTRNAIDAGFRLVERLTPKKTPEERVTIKRGTDDEIKVYVDSVHVADCTPEGGDQVLKALVASLKSEGASK